MSAVGPMFGQVGFFHKFAGKEYEDKRPRDRYVAEARRLLGVLDRRLADRPWLTGEGYTIAHIATLPLGNKFNRFLRRSGARDVQRIHARRTRSESLPCASGGGAWARYPKAWMKGTCRR